MLKLEIKGNPVSKKRPRFARLKNFTVAYSDQKTEEGRFLLAVREQLNGVKPLTGVIFVSIWFNMKRPKNHYGTGKNVGVLKKSSPLMHSKKPDIDNLIKFTLDCLNGEAWKDDAQICSLTAIKRYNDSGHPSTVIAIHAAEEV